MNNIIDSDQIKKHLIHDLQNIDIHIFDSIDSTNSHLKSILKDTSGEFTTIIANEQTKGRGRLGKNFFSPADTGIYMSFAIKPDTIAIEATFITTATSVAICKAIEKVTGLNPQIKWVNDIYIENKKVCGILTEAVTNVESGKLSGIIIGIGINVTTSSDDFPDDIKNIAASLSNNININRNELITSILNEFYILYNNYSDSYMDEYRRRSLILNKEIYYIQNDIKYYATAIDFTDNGGLIVRNNDGKITTLTSGEITLRLI